MWHVTLTTVTWLVTLTTAGMCFLHMGLQLAPLAVFLVTMGALVRLVAHVATQMPCHITAMHHFPFTDQTGVNKVPAILVWRHVTVEAFVWPDFQFTVWAGNSPRGASGCGILLWLIWLVRLWNTARRYLQGVTFSWMDTRNSTPTLSLSIAQISISRLSMSIANVNCQ